jgi:hypothetical protein
MSRQRIGDDQRRRSEIIGAHIRIDAALEIAITGKHRRGDEVVLLDRLRDRFRQWARIADAGGAAIAHEIEAELVEVLLQTGRLEIFGHHLAARGERGLDPRLDGEALLHRIAGEKAGADHHGRIGGVGA